MDRPLRDALNRRRARRLVGRAALVAVAAALLPCHALAQTAPAPGSTRSTASGSPTSAPAARDRRGRGPPGSPEPIPKVAEQRRRYGPLSATAEAKEGTWQVDFYAGGIDRVQVIVDSATGEIRESWTGYQVAWQMARGYSGQFGHKLNAPYVWLPLAAIFLLALFDFRRTLRIAHLDLLVLLSLRDLRDLLQRRADRPQRPARLPAARVPARADDLDRLPTDRGTGLRPSTPTAWLAIGGAFLLGFRIALNIADSGRDRRRLRRGYRGRPSHPRPGDLGRTSRPTTRSATHTARSTTTCYVPFELALPWTVSGTTSPAAHARGHLLRSRDGGGPVRTRRGALRPGRDGARLGVDPRLCVGGLPVHRLRAPVELERHPRRGPARLGAGRVRRPRVARRAAGALGGHEVRAVAASALVRGRRGRLRRRATGPEASGSRSTGRRPCSYSPSPSRSA